MPIKPCALPDETKVDDRARNLYNLCSVLIIGEEEAAVGCISRTAEAKPWTRGRAPPLQFHRAHEVPCA